MCNPVQLQNLAPHQMGAINGARGTFLVAAELSKLGLMASPTFGNAPNVDIVVARRDAAVAFTVQVKTKTRNDKFWLVGQQPIPTSSTHLYVFVEIRRPRKNTPCEIITFYVVPSGVVKKNVRGEPRFRCVDLHKIEQYKNHWNLFGNKDYPIESWSHGTTIYRS